MSHALTRVLDPLVELNEQQFSVMKALDLPLLVLTRTEDDMMSHNIMNSIAQQDLSGRFFVGVMTNALSGQAVEYKPPYLTAFNVLDETVPTYQGPFERTLVLEFANNVSSPLIRQFDSFSLVSFMAVNVP